MAGPREELVTLGPEQVRTVGTALFERVGYLSALRRVAVREATAAPRYVPAHVAPSITGICDAITLSFSTLHARVDRLPSSRAWRENVASAKLPDGLPDLTRRR